MNYQSFTNDSLTMMYEGIRGALASDNALNGLGEESRFVSGRPPNGSFTRPISKRNALAWNDLRDHRLVRGSGKAAFRLMTPGGASRPARWPIHKRRPIRSIMAACT
jgi:hypothetical protein